MLTVNLFVRIHFVTVYILIRGILHVLIVIMSAVPLLFLHRPLVYLVSALSARIRSPVVLFPAPIEFRVRLGTFLAVLVINHHLRCFRHMSAIPVAKLVVIFRRGGDRLPEPPVLLVSDAI